VAGTYAQPGGFYGESLTGDASLESVTPQLSKNGQEVAILSNKPRTGEASQGGGLEEEGTPSTANAYVVNMASGLSRTQALTQLTEWASYDFKDDAPTSPVENIAISANGAEVAFTTARTEFPLAPPALITPELSQATYTQLYVANLAAGTLSLVSYGYEGEAANGNVATPSFTGGGETLAFASSATNLVYGAFNKGGTEGAGPGNVFVISEVSTPAVAGVQTIGPAPANPLAPQPWELLASTAPGPHGTVLVYVTVPGAGTLKASAKAEVPETVTVTSRGKGKRARKRKRTILADRTVASAKASARGGGLIELRLTSARAYRALVDSHDGLYATIELTFAVKGRPTLTKSVQATFHGKAAEPAKKASAKPAKKSDSKTKQGAKRGKTAGQGRGA
jgi:hypothetical protein